MSDQDILTVKQVAQLLQLKETTIYAWAQHGKIPAAKVGHSWIFRESEITLWLDSHLLSQERS
jgi:excisionase family DNA binding protein